MTKQLSFPMSPLSLVQLGLILWLSCTSLFAQVKQAGLVRLLNSKNQILPGVSIIFEDAGPETSGTDGRFNLNFPNKKPGDLIFLKDISKSGHELVNEKSFQFIKASNNGQLATDIIMAPIGTVEAAKKEYYAVSSTAVKAIYEQQLRALQTQLQKAQYSQEQYAQKLAELQLRFEEQKKQLDHLADRFARVNFDDVSDLYREALELFKAGKIEEAIKKLESANLLERIQKRLKEQVKIEAEDTLLTLQIQENNRALSKDLEVLQLQTQLYLSQQQQTPPKPLLDSNKLELFEQARQYLLLRDTNSCLMTYQKIVQQSKASLEQKAIAYQMLGDLYQFQQKNTLALTAFQQYYASTKKLLAIDPKSAVNMRHLMIASSRLGTFYIAQGTFDTALSYFEEGSKINEKLIQSIPGDPILKFNLAIMYIEAANLLSKTAPQKAQTHAASAEKILLELIKIYPQQGSRYRTYLEIARRLLIK